MFQKLNILLLTLFISLVSAVNSFAADGVTFSSESGKEGLITAVSLADTTANIQTIGAALIALGFVALGLRWVMSFSGAGRR